MCCEDLEWKKVRFLKTSDSLNNKKVEISTTFVFVYILSVSVSHGSVLPLLFLRLNIICFFPSPFLYHASFSYLLCTYSLCVVLIMSLFGIFKPFYPFLFAFSFSNHRSNVFTCSYLNFSRWFLFTLCLFDH